MDDLVKLDNGEYGITKASVDSIIIIEKQVKELKEMQDSIRAELLKQMEEHNVIKIDTPELSITRKESTTRESLDSKALKEELPDVYDSYVRFTNVKGSLLLKIKEKTEAEKKLEEIEKLIK